MSIIEVKNLNKSFKTKVKKSGFKSSLLSLVSPQYRDIEAVKGINFNVCKGEVLAFIGPNGAGKSTTIKVLTGILHPTSGSVKVLGLDPQRDRKKLAYKIGNVFGQKSQLWFHLPPMDSLKLLGSIYEVSQRELEKRISQLVELFEIKDLIDVPVRKLSLGQRIRCEIAASLLHKPEVLFLDEPTIGLDIIAKQKIRDLIIRLNQEENTTIFLTSHDVGDIEQLCSRAIIINNGQLVLDDSVQHLKNDYLSKKIIEIKYTERVEPQVTGYEKQSEYEGRVEVNTESQSLHEIMAQLMNAGSIADITVSNQPLEEIIAAIYERTQGG
ncbi:MAG TPA: ATP-binding cassette domain-containing protein [Clostridia bacterium]|nr:ATP-binding cassette domain-containing protein [Clostridia bacterium]